MPGVYSAKRQKVLQETHGEESSSPHEWIIVKFCSRTYWGPSEQAQLKPTHRKNKDKHSCQPPATLFKYLSAESIYIHVKMRADWWLTVKCPFSAFENLNILVHDTIKQYIYCSIFYGFITLFDGQNVTQYKKEYFLPKLSSFKLWISTSFQLWLLLANLRSCLHPHRTWCLGQRTGKHTLVKLSHVLEGPNSSTNGQKLTYMLIYFENIQRMCYIL